MVVTTALQSTESLKTKALVISQQIGILFVNRDEKPLATLQKELSEDILVVGKDKLVLYKKGDSTPFFFHPNSAMFRIKRLLRKEVDPFINACQLTFGMSLLDCTLGLGSDSIVASAVVGNKGRITGLEVNPIVAFIVKEGLKIWETNSDAVNQAMRRIEVLSISHEEYLPLLETSSVDIVYFDPMFEEKIDSDGILPLKQLVEKRKLTESVIEEAKRVARKRVILKDHFRSERFSKYQFQVIKRPSSKFHFGYIECSY